MANNVDHPDHTAPEETDLGLHCLHRLSLSKHTFLEILLVVK